MHIVLLDNGRSEMRADPRFKEALRCIRCAACANICPAYQQVGGHAFGYIYSGANRGLTSIHSESILVLEQ